MKNIVIWAIIALLAFFASGTIVFAIERGYANRYRKKGRQVRLGLAPRIVGALVVILTNLLLLAVTKAPAIAVVIMILLTLVWAAAELLMLVREVNLLTPALLAIASHFIVVTLYAYGGEMTIWPGWYTLCLFVELLLAVLLVVIRALYGLVLRNAEEFKEDWKQQKEEAAAKQAKKKKVRQLDREVDDELEDEARDKAGVVITILVILVLIIIASVLAWKLQLLPFI